jgi:hypothetical protein
VESKRGRIRRVKYWQIAFVVTLSTSITLAEDFKTVTGKEYKDVTISRVERDGIVLRSKTGISKVYFTELPKDVQEKFHYAQATPRPAQREPLKVEPKQDERPQAHGGGKVVVVGQSAGSLKIFIVGIVVLVVVVLAIVRSRF